MSVSHRAGLSLFLNRLLLRSTLTVEEQEAILGLPSRTSMAAANGELVSPGATVDATLIVVSGVVGRFDRTRDGRRQITAFYLPGDACDLHSVAAPRSSAGLVALCATTVLRIPHDDLKDVAGKHPDLAMAILRDIAADASLLAKWLVNVGSKDARARVAHLFCEVGIRVERAGFGTRDRYALPLNQEQIADATGLTPVHVSRTLKVLRDDGIVSMRRREVEIADWDRLASAAEFDSAFMLF